MVPSRRISKQFLNTVRKDIADTLKAGGYGVVESPGPNVLYIRAAITDLMLQRKKRRLLAYTPIGFVLKAGADAMRDMMEKYDIMGDRGPGPTPGQPVE